MDYLELLLKYGLGGWALREIWMLRGEVRKGFESVTRALEGHEDRIEDHERRIRDIEEDHTWKSS
jgi:hypothetical protein